MAETLDSRVALCLVWLAVWILLSGLDDLFVLLVFLRCAFRPAPPVTLNPLIETSIAVFVPCWLEDRVIGDMVEHNISAIRYSNYAFFLGVYPNDEPTVDAVRRLESCHARVHVSLCPHDGPTSKADCLNWIYQRMLLYEEEHDARFDLILTHDAEDLIHPEALAEANRHAASYDFIQLPVLPLPTRFPGLTHALYADDFAESHTKDLVARQALGGFIPSSGVGTACRREALEALAAAESNRIFEPSCLTEDYENGIRLHRAGRRQLFVPIRFSGGAPLATREYFPDSFRQAVRQRARWVTGIAFQSWERHGWMTQARQRYWLWRDRKSVVGYPVSLIANLLFGYGAATWAAARISGADWGLRRHLDQPVMLALLAATFVLQFIQLAVRAFCSARVYGWRFAAGVPVRAIYGNWLNALSVFVALGRYLRARLLRQPLVWVKTEHAYPSRASLLPHKRPLEEILVGSGYLTEWALATARASQPDGVRLAEHLVQAGLLSEEELYEALALQLGLALGRIDPSEVNRDVARTLPAWLIRKWNVLPVRIESGNLLVASPDVPSDELETDLRRHTRLAIRVQLVTPTNFRRLAEALL